MKTKKSGLLNCGLGVMHCGKQWDDFEKTDNSNIRFCSLCRKRIFLFQSAAHVNQLLKNQHVVYRQNIDEPFRKKPQSETKK